MDNQPMAELLKKVKSTIHPNKQSKQTNPNDPNTQPDLGVGFHYPTGTSCNGGLESYPEQQTDPHNQVTTLRQRLARKASTISLRAKGRNGQKVKSKRPLLESRADSCNSLGEEAVAAARPRLVDKSLPATPPSDPCKPSSTTVHDRSPSQRNFSHPLPPNVERGPPSTTGGTWIKMSSETSSPPVPFSKLKEITEEVHFCPIFHTSPICCRGPQLNSIHHTPL